MRENGEKEEEKRNMKGDGRCGCLHGEGVMRKPLLETNDEFGRVRMLVFIGFYSSTFFFVNGMGKKSERGMT